MSYIGVLILFILSAGNVDGQFLEIGQKAPEILLTSIDGKEIRLSSCKGQMVLIDFWASWCGPCRKENPLIVSIYLKYKDKSFKNGEGFTIFSVSMDTKEVSWKEAIIKDKLEWPNHVCDMKGWKSEAAILYNIKEIPYSYLIDGEGIIVAINPRGEKLESELRKLRKGKVRSIF